MFLGQLSEVTNFLPLFLCQTDNSLQFFITYSCPRNRAADLEDVPLAGNDITRGEDHAMGRKILKITAQENTVLHRPTFRPRVGKLHVPYL